MISLLIHQGENSGALEEGEAIRWENSRSLSTCAEQTSPPQSTYFILAVFSH